MHDEDPTQSDREENAEVEIKEKRVEISESNGQIVIRTREAKWTVQSFDDLPEWLKDNEYLLSGHRPHLPSFSECFKSLWAIHTETGNIWTHLIGAVIFVILAVWFWTRSDFDFPLQEKVIFLSFFASAIVCLGLSSAFHLFSCHSASTLKLFSKLDYTGISLLIIGSYIPWMYYGFYCRRGPKIAYITMICLLGVAATIVSLWDEFNKSKYRVLRAVVFLTMGCSGIIPVAHSIITEGFKRSLDENALHWILIMAFFYIFGAFLYATRIPERFRPGKHDILFSSHQLFHVCVVIAASIYFYGVSDMAMKKLIAGCANEMLVGHQEAKTEL